VAFPSEAPDRPTGPGAIVWSSQQSRCGRRAGAAGSQSKLTVARLGSSGRPGRGLTRELAGALSGEPAAVGASFGRVAVAVGLRPETQAGARTVQLREGRAPPFPKAALSDPGAPFSLARAYLGDVALATVGRGAIAVRVQRYFMRGFGAARLVPIGRGTVGALYATMDYRSDVLLAWQQNGAVYAEMLRASGRSDPIQRLGPSGANPQLQALVSDNDHGVVAWSSPAAAGRPASRTRVYFDRSGDGVRFAAPRLLASFADPSGAGRAPGSLVIVRLSTENAVIAWTVADHGHYQVLGSPTGFAGVRTATRLSDPHRQAVLAGLAAGPEGEAIALWTGAPRGAPESRPRTQLWAARTFIVPHDRLTLRPPEMLAVPGRVAAPSAAVDPSDDRAVVAWLAEGKRSVEVSVSAAMPKGAGRDHARRGLGSTASAGGGAPWLAIALAAAAVGAGAVLGVRVRGRRRDSR